VYRLSVLAPARYCVEIVFVDADPVQTMRCQIPVDKNLGLLLYLKATVAVVPEDGIGPGRHGLVSHPTALLSGSSGQIEFMYNASWRVQLPNACLQTSSHDS
jgi:hypothetical protein